MKRLTGALLPVTEGRSLIIVAESTAVGSRYGVRSVAESLNLIQKHEAERNGGGGGEGRRGRQSEGD